MSEPGADPEELLTAAEQEAALAADLLDASDVETAAAHLRRSEEAAAEAARLLESVVAARERAEGLIASLAARLESLAVAGQGAGADLGILADRFAESAWGDLADHPAAAAEAAKRARTLLDEGRADAHVSRQSYFRGRGARGGAAAGRLGRRLPRGRLGPTPRTRGTRDGRPRIAAPGGRTDRRLGDAARLAPHRPRRANERCREAQRLVETGDRLAAAGRPDPRQVEQALRAADSATARGEEFADDDERLARQAAADLTEAEGLFRRAASWYDEGIKADVHGVERSLQDARSLLSQQRYEDSIRVSCEAAEPPGSPTLRPRPKPSGAGPGGWPSSSDGSSRSRLRG